MRKKNRIIYIVICVIGLLLLIELIPNTTTKDKSNDSGIYILKRINLGGYKQTILIRGKDRTNPLMIILHGGPGFANISFIKKFQKEVEQKYVVVNWDQRGAGKSYSIWLNKSTMNEQQLLEDLDQLITYLCDEYRKEKVYIVGHSWGTVLGKDYVQLYPEKVKYYISIGQYVSEKHSSIYSYEYLLDEAKKRNDSNSLKKLIEIGTPKYSEDIRNKRVLRKYINKYGGNEVSINISHEMIKGAILEPEYSMIDLLKLAIGNYYSIYYLYSDYINRDFREEKLHFEVPVLFIIGKKDLVTNSKLVEEYFKSIECTEKTLIWFNKSAHDPQYDEVEKYSNKLNDLLE